MVGTQRIASGLKSFAKGLQKGGRALGTAGIILTTIQYFDEGQRGTLTDGKHVAFFTGLLVTGVSILTGGTAGAVIALVYGAIELYSYCHFDKRSVE